MTQPTRPTGPRPPVRPLGYAGRAPRPTTPAASRAAAIAEEQRRQDLWDWLKPLIMVGASALVIMFAPLIIAGEFSIEALAVMGIGVLILAVIKTVLALLMALGIALLFGSGFESFWREIIRLAAIVMVATASMVVFEPFIGCFAIFVYAGVIVTMMMTMMDLEQGEAILFTFVFIVAEIATYIWLTSLLESLFS